MRCTQGENGTNNKYRKSKIALCQKIFSTRENSKNSTGNRGAQGPTQKLRVAQSQTQI